MIYEITEKRFTNEDNVDYLGYGILARDGILELKIDDVSLDRSEVESYIATLQERQIPFCEIANVVVELINCTYVYVM